MVLVIVNIILEKKGIDVIPADESTVTMFVESLIEIAVIIVSFWKNNSFSKNAIKADEYLKALNEEDYEGEVVEW
jgi:SPP1 family holin